MKARTVFTLPAIFLVTLLVRAQAPFAAFTVAGPIGGGLVKDAPYSADVVTTYDRVLPSGEPLHGETHGKVCRDSQGRTRTESDSASPAAPAQKVVFIVINDPVQHAVITLDPRSMTARVNAWLSAPDATTGANPRPTASGQSPVPSRSPSSPPGASPVPVPAAAAGAAFVASGMAKTEDLGTRDIEGVTVTGTRVTRTIAPALGQSEPRTMVSTTWVSPELKIAVLTETEDAQSGHRATRLVNIVRTEPDDALFRVPAGYTVTDSRPKN